MMAGQQDMYLLLGEIRGDVKYLRESREAANVRIDALENNMREQQEKLETRVSVLEGFRMKIAGITVALGTASPLAMWFLQEIISR